MKTKAEMLFNLHAVSMSSTLLFLLSFIYNEKYAPVIQFLIYLINFNLIYALIFYLKGHMKNTKKLIINILPYLIIFFFINFYALNIYIFLFAIVVFLHLLFLTDINYYEIDPKESILKFFITKSPKINIILFLGYVILLGIFFYTKY